MKQPNVVFIISDDQGSGRWAAQATGRYILQTSTVWLLRACVLRIFLRFAGMLTGESFAADRVYPVSARCA